MVNLGIAPPDPDTPVGQFRLASGDISYVPLDPPQPGYGDYGIWSDADINTFLTLTGGNIPRAIAIGYRQIAASVSASSIKTDDLSINDKEEFEKWMKLAAYWDGVADGDDGRAIDDYFDLVPVRHKTYLHPEASPWPWRC